MCKKYVASAALLSALLLLICCGQAAAVSEVSFESHDIRLTIDVPSHMAVVSDSGTVHIRRGWNAFGLSRGAQIDEFLIDGRSRDYRTINAPDTTQAAVELKDSLPDFDGAEQIQIVRFEAEDEGAATFQIRYHAEFYQDVGNIRFSNELVGGEVFGSIEERGAYLSSSAYYYPRGAESLLHFRLTADIPENWESISGGNRLSSQAHDGRKLQTWENPFKSDGCMFMAAPYVTKSIQVDSVEVACYFFEDDTLLIDDYLTATANYIRMYDDLIGAYPYERFTVAENFFPTGYGMPGWTLLGQQVLRLPFIKYTSLGHEVLHNWWGNSVYVDYERGNWCEAATVYGADYRYKLEQSPTAAQAYRKNILKQYDSYVNEGNDFPIREFQSRTSPNTRTIGYNKAMMVYHMIEQETGTKAFFDTWKQVYADYREMRISWEEWIDEFEKTTGRDLSHYIPQWIDRAGAPVIDLEVVMGVKALGDSVQLRLMEKSGQNYELLVPLRFSGTDIRRDTSVYLVGNDSVFTLSVPQGVTDVAVDPDYHLFRRLYPEEIEPIISAALGGPEKAFVAGVSTGIVEDFASFGRNLSGDSVEVVSAESFVAGRNAGTPILLNPESLPADLQRRVSIAHDSIEVAGTPYPVENHTFVLAGQNWDGHDDYLVILCGDGSSLPRIGQLVPHYGKYSFLVFDGATNVGKGQWEVSDSRLKQSLL